MKVWFMYDNHTFTSYDGPIDADPLLEWVTARFAEDRYGMVSAYNAKNSRVGAALNIGQIDKFIDAVIEHENWEARG